MTVWIFNVATRKKKGGEDFCVFSVEYLVPELSSMLGGSAWQSCPTLALCLCHTPGHCWAHHRCAEWSVGVCQTEEQLSLNVDKAVVSGSTEVSKTTWMLKFCKKTGWVRLIKRQIQYRVWLKISTDGSLSSHL